MPKPRILTYEEIDLLKNALDEGQDWTLDPRRGDVRARLIATLEARTNQTNHWRDTANKLVEERSKLDEKEFDEVLASTLEERDRLAKLYDDIIRIEDEVLGHKAATQDALQEIFLREKKVLARELEVDKLMKKYSRLNQELVDKITALEIEKKPTKKKKTSSKKKAVK